MSSQKGLPDQFREISALDRKACVDRWTAVFGTAPPKYLSVRFMQRVFARQLQIRVLGDYPGPIRRALKAASGAAQLGKPLPRLAAPGSYLMREWNGRTYQVEVTSSGYVLDGQSYASLSTVAKRITGAHWSGPRFFGLTRKRTH
ncbi:DUF2924 domain-containing protein [Phaeovulum sp.]|uniref:DUF2924 domain-containing protein n=1 Tax=Phaeovulum sp. TaxID=2934796 RepID=UPI0035689589